MPASLDALKNASLLANLDSPVNGNRFPQVGQYPSLDEVRARGDVALADATPDDLSAPGGVVVTGPTAGDMVRDDAINHRALDALTAGPLGRQAEDMVLSRRAMAGQQADLESGIPERIAALQGDVRNIGTEKAAEGQFMPFSEQLADRTRADKTALAQLQYALPAMLKSQTDLQGAQIAGQSRIAAAQAAHPQKSPLDYLLESIRGAAAKGIVLDPKDIATLQQQFGVQR